jgi:amino acid transporter
MLRARLSLTQSISVNMSTMVGIGPFITIPVFLAKMGGPHALIGWVLGAVVALADGLVWSELAAAFPGSGGTYHFYDAVYGARRIGRMLKFLFVWQFLLSGPLEIASGAIGISQYAGYLWPVLKSVAWEASLNVPLAGVVKPKIVNGQLFAILVMGAITWLAYRRIEAAGRVMLILWLGMLATVTWVIVVGLARFDASIAFDLPPGAWTLNSRFALGLGAALGVAMYDFLGYYQICYLGDEVHDAPRTLPIAILISVVLVALIYLMMNLSIIGVIPWREVIASSHIGSDLMLRLQGPNAARLITALIVWTAFASCFAALLSYSRIPYASARSGQFFVSLAQTHSRGDFPHRSLLLVAAISMLACLFPLDSVISALLASRIIIQFVGQIATVFYVRLRPDLSSRLRFRMVLFPIPAFVALAGWLYVFRTTDQWILAFGIGSLAVGLLAFLAWDRSSTSTPVVLHEDKG